MDNRAPKGLVSTASMSLRQNMQITRKTKDVEVPIQSTFNVSIIICEFGFSLRTDNDRCDLRSKYCKDPVIYAFLEIDGIYHRYGYILSWMRNFFALYSKDTVSAR